MSGTKIKTLLKNLKTQNETTIETFQELPLTIQDDSYVTPVNLKVSLTADSVDLRPEDGGIGLGISASTISLGSSTTVVGSTLTATNISFTGNLEGLSQDTIESDGDITLIPGADSLVKILKESADGSAVGMLIRKPNQGSAVITMGESADGTEDHSYTNGFRLAYQGDGVTGETQGLDYNDMGAIQALDVTSVTDGGVTTYTQNIHNVMEWSRAGEDVKVSSKDDLKLEFKWRNNGTPYAQLDVDLSDKFVDVDPQTKYPVLKSTVSGTEHNNFSTSSTSLRSYRDLILTVGMGFNDNTNLANENQSPPKISICKPTFSNYDMQGEVEVASIDHTGKAAFSEVTASTLTGDNLVVNGDIFCDHIRTNSSTFVLRADDDGDSANDNFVFAGETGGVLHRYLTLREAAVYGHELELKNPLPGERLPVFHTNITGSSSDDYSSSRTSIRSWGNINLTPGMGHDGSDSIGADDAKISFCRPTWSTDSDGNIYVSGETVNAFINSGGDASFQRLTLLDIPSDNSLTNSSQSYYLGVDGNGIVYKKTSTSTPGAYFFTGQHTYHSTEALPVGACVQLISGVLSLTTTPSSKVCCGVVNKSFECTEESPISTSLQETISSGYVVSVLSVGDSREADCQGFNVCNENGDIQPGDLLVTSNTPGYLMKQDDDIIRSCTVGKAMETATFDENGQATGVYGYLYCG